MPTNTYSKGYQAGIKKGKKDAQNEIDLLKNKVDEQAERVYLRCLEIALAHCRGWSVGGKPTNDVSGYCKLAKILADNSIDMINS